LKNKQFREIGMRTRHRNTPPIPRYTPLIAALVAAFPAHEAMANPPRPAGCTDATPIVCTITNPADDYLSPPPGSLREALGYLNSYYYDALENYVPRCTGNDVVKFSGAFTVAASNSLYVNCGGLTIDGSVGRDRAGINGSAQPYGVGLDVFFLPDNGRRVSVRNLDVSGFMYGTGILGNVDASKVSLHGNDTGIELHQGASVRDSEIFANCTGIYTSYGGTDITGNTITGNCGGVYLMGTDSAHIANNRIGVDAAGNPAGNTWEGVYVEDSAADIDGNIISANGTGIYLEGAFNTAIHGNKIGTDPTGNVAMGNEVGIYSGSFSYGTEIFNNTVSGNSDTGVDLSEVSGVSITNNAIGTNTAGSAALPNTRGISAYCGSDFNISNNLVSGNSSNGIEMADISGGGTLQVSGNKIGVAGDGVTALGNNAYGIMVNFSSGCTYGGPPQTATARTATAKAVRAKLYAPRIGVQSVSGMTFSNNTIANNSSAGLAFMDGSNNTITGNTIRNNVGQGVYFFQGTGNSIVQNAIYDNGGKNIDLGFAGSPLPNDPGDPDSGPNNGQNYPIAGPIVRSGPNTTISFSLDSGPGLYRIDFYSNSASVPGGKVYEGNTFVSSGVAGSFTIAKTTVDNFSLTATSPTNDTSEFSPVAFVQTSPDVSITPTGIDFGNTAIGSRSPDRAVTINSTGTAPYVIDSISGSGSCYGGAICYGGPFVCSTNCVTGTAMPKPNSCNITASFAPTALGTYTTTIRICDNTSTRVRDIVLTGNAVIPPPVTIDPPQFDFGDTLVGQRSAVKTFHVTNPGTASIPLGRVVTTGDFLLDSTTCATALAGGASCDANVVFGPLTVGPADGSLQVQAGGAITEPIGSTPLGGSTHALTAAPNGATARLSGLGTTEADAVLPTALDLGTQTRGDAALSRAFNIQSRGNQGLEISSITTSAPFGVSHNCPAVLPPGNDCTVTVTYTSNALGTFNGRLMVITNSAKGSGAVQLTGRTVEVAAPLLRLSANSMGFGGRILGTPSPTQRVTVENVGNIAATFASVVTSNLDFIVSSTTCNGSLLPANSCTVDVAMRPIGFGPRTGILLVNSNATGSPHTVSLAGSGCRPFTGAGARNGSRDNCAP
jgi:trimeric autotransporter adhesin